MKKLIILDCSDSTVGVFTIDTTPYTNDGDFEIVTALDHINEHYDVYYRASEIEWMLSDIDLSITIY